MKEIYLTQNQKTLVDDEDYNKFNIFKWHASFLNNKNFYAGRKISKERFKQINVYLHREIMNATKNDHVDHINGDTLDNRKENLRICINRDNIKNQRIRSNNTSGYKGVSLKYNKWVARIMFNNKTKYLGVFINKEDAAKAYNEAALKYHGEFARLNIIK